MERRRFLSWAAGGTVAACLPACGGGGGDDGPAVAPADPPLDPAPSGGPSRADWEALARQLQGRLLRPGEADYEQGRVAANTRYDALRPIALVRCAAPADIGTALAFARRQQLAIVPRGGGHSYIGNSTGAGLVIDVGPLDAVRLDGEIATVGAGAKLADVYAQLIARGRCVPSGSCLSVGIAGITLGGGFGVLDRAHGLGCDALLGAQMIGADGLPIDCDAERNADLFWALRGGGGGNFGIVSAFSFRTHALTPLTQFQALFGLDELPAVMSAWQAWPHTMPDAIWSQLVLAPQNGPAGAAGCYLWGIGVGEAASLAPHWQALLQRIGRAPASSAVQPRSYAEVMLGACAGLSAAQCHLPSQHPAGRLGRVAMVASSDFFDGTLPAAGMQALAGAIQQRRGAGRAGSIVMNLMGGAIARVAPEATAFAHRRALFSAQYLAEFAPGTAAATLDEAAQWTHGMRAVMQAWSSGRAYQNYLDALIPDPEQAYYAGNLARLKQLKARYDPTALFRQAQGITAA